jgi:hypothetical protein
MSLSKSKCLYSYNCLHFLKCCVPFKFHRIVLWPTICFTRQSFGQLSISSNNHKVNSLSHQVVIWSTFSLIMLSFGQLCISSNSHLVWCLSLHVVIGQLSLLSNSHLVNFVSHHIVIRLTFFHI